MTETIHLLIEKYGLLAVFFGCVAEGESAAILGGFFTHQHLFAPWRAFVAAFTGAYSGDALLFMAGRVLSETAFVRRQKSKPAFARALDEVKRRPISFILLSRYAYGFRLIAHVAAGMSAMSTVQFATVNVLASAIWAMIFLALGYIFGVGAEQVIGAALHKHERLLIALAVAIVVTAAARTASRLLRRRVSIERP